MQPIVQLSVIKVTGHTASDTEDVLAMEEPLELRIEWMHHGRAMRKSISVTMRTPGNDENLATGFLYTEGIIVAPEDILSVTHTGERTENVITVALASHVVPDIARLERNFYTTSSCGVCGKASIEAVRTTCPILDTKDNMQIPASALYDLPAALSSRQDVFAQTGGLHAAALFDLRGELQTLFEDVGRHNALDKLVGNALGHHLLPLQSHILLLSGRASFELMQKAAMAGIKIVAAVGAPSSLAVQMAEEWGITLVGFLRQRRFNIYAGAQRIVI